MVYRRRSLSALCVALALTGCAVEPPPRVVERQVIVNVPGPTQFVPVDRSLLGCTAADEPGRPVVLEDGILGGELVARAQGWQVYAECLEGKLAQIGQLSAPPP